MAAIGDIITADTWVSAFTIANLLSGSPLEIENIGQEELRYVVFLNILCYEGPLDYPV